MVVPKGPFLAFSWSTWIHWWSSVASANVSIRVWSTVSQSLAPTLVPAAPFSSSGPLKIRTAAPCPSPPITAPINALPAHTATPGPAHTLLRMAADTMVELDRGRGREDDRRSGAPGGDAAGATRRRLARSRGLQHTRRPGRSAGPAHRRRHRRGRSGPRRARPRRAPGAARRPGRRRGLGAL